MSSLTAIEQARKSTRELLQQTTDEWRAWLERRHFPIFATLTWKRQFSPELMYKQFRQWLVECRLQNALRCGEADRVQGESGFVGRLRNRLNRGKGHVAYLYGTERGKLGRLHAHAIIAPDPHLTRWDLRLCWSLWFKRFGRAKIEYIDHPDRCLVYVTKYVVKQGVLEVSSDLTSAVYPRAKVLRACHWPEPENGAAEPVGPVGEAVPF